MKKLTLVILTLFSAISIYAQTPAQLAQLQLDAYNNQDIEAFLSPYADTVKIYNFPNQLSMQGKEAMRERYGKMFQNTSDLHCTLTGRTVLGNTVIDKEYVIFNKNRPASEVIAIYKIADSKIIEVYFIRKD